MYGGLSDAFIFTIGHYELNGVGAHAHFIYEYLQLPFESTREKKKP